MGTLHIERVADGTLRIEMARPDVLNAFDETMISEVEGAFAQASRDPEVRCVLLCGQGRAFCAGADIQWMKRQSEAAELANLADARKFAAMLHAIASCPKPTIARIQGACMGGGIGLVCACDFAIASDNARFSVSEARFGILPAVISPYLIAAVGVRRAQQLAISTLRIDAGQALAMGLVSKVVPESQLDDATHALARELHAAGPGAIAEIKSLYSRLGALASPEVRELTAATIARVRGTAEAREGFDAFLEKRPPRGAAMAEVFRREKRVRFSHCDPAGIVFYPQYFVMIHELMEDWFTEALGVDYAALVRDQGRGMPAVKVECEFLAPNPLGDVIAFELSVAKVGASSLTIRVEGAARGAACVRATVVLVHSSLKPLKALPFPEKLRAGLARFMAS